MLEFKVGKFVIRRDWWVWRYDFGEVEVGFKNGREVGWGVLWGRG